MCARIAGKKQSLLDSAAAFAFRRGLRGAARLHAVLLNGRRIRAKSRHGVVFELNPLEYIDRLVLRHGYYEEEVLDAILSRLNPGDVFWDVGANLGLHALTVAALRPDVKVYAFEPNPAMASLIAAACEANGLPVSLFEIALDSHAGRATFFLHRGNTGMSGLHNWGGDPDLEQTEVSTDTADNLIATGAASSPQVVKIDVEGNEDRVLQGLRRTLQAGGVHSVIFEDSPAETSPVKSALLGAGFTLRTLARREATAHNLENYIAVKNPKNPGTFQSPISPASAPASPVT